MARRSFFDIIQNSQINLQAEYDRLYVLFYDGDDDKGRYAVHDIINENYEYIPQIFVGRTISLDDFNSTYGFMFDRYCHATVETLLLFCEYIYNFYDQLTTHCFLCLSDDERSDLDYISRIVSSCMDELGFMPCKKDGITIYVEKDPAVIAVAEIVREELAFDIWEYNHFRLRGDIKKKKAILKQMADEFENKAIRNQLKSINATLESQLYQLLNKFIRHDHSLTPEITSMDNETLESWYDDIYQMWLLARLELDHLERKDRAAELLAKINS